MNKSRSRFVYFVGYSLWLFDFRLSSLAYRSLVVGKTFSRLTTFAETRLDMNPTRVGQSRVFITVKDAVSY